MVAKPTQADRDLKFQDLANEVQEIKIIQTQVFQPALKRIEATTQTIAQRDFITRSEAANIYMTKSDFKPYAFTLGTIATIALGVIVTAILRGVVK